MSSNFDLINSMDSRFNQFESTRKVHAAVLIDYSGHGNLALDVANPKAKPSLMNKQMFQNLDESVSYVCVNPDQKEKAAKIGGHEVDIVEGDGLDEKQVNKIIENFNGKNTFYFIVQGLSQLLTYYISDHLGKNPLDSIQDRGKQKPYHKSSLQYLARTLTKTESKYILLSENFSDRGGEIYLEDSLSLKAIEYLAETLEEFDWNVHVKRSDQDFMLAAER